MLFSVLNDISRLLIGQQIFISSIFCGAGHTTSKNGVLLISPEWIISFEIRVQPDRGFSFSRTFLFFIRKDVLNFSIFLEMIFLSHKSKFWGNILIARAYSLLFQSDFCNKSLSNDNSVNYQSPMDVDAKSRLSSLLTLK